jgi:hypothetical protein
VVGLMIGLVAALAIAALPTPLMAAKPPVGATSVLPQVNLLVEFRLRPADERPGRPGDLLVSTGRVPDTDPDRTRSTRPRDGLETPLPPLRVRNGGRAEVALTRWQLAPRTRWVWTSQGQGLSGGDELRSEPAAMVVQPRWAGGRQPVELDVQLAWPAVSSGGAAAVPADSRRLDAQLYVVLGQWTEISRLNDPGTPAEGRLPQDTVSTSDAATRRGQVIEIRISVP